MKPLPNIVILILCIAVVMTIGFVSGMKTAGSITTWYAEIKKPAFNPPNAVFGPVWSVLYLLMGIGIYLIITAPANPHKQLAITLFCIQLALNFFWSILFFNYHLTGWALIEIGLMWLAILTTILIFKKISPTAAWLQIPYLLWVTFASILNAAIWQLNR